MHFIGTKQLASWKYRPRIARCHRVRGGWALTCAHPPMENDTISCLQRLGLSATVELLSRVVLIPRATVVFRAGEPCRGYPVVVSGGVRVCRAGSLGHDVVFYRVRPGEGCAVSAGCLLDGQRYPVFGVADSDCRVLLLPPALFRLYFASNATFREFVFRQYAKRVGALMGRIDSLISEPPGLRLAKYLLAHMEQGQVVMSHAELAADIGTAREVVSRQLGRWARAGWVRQRRHAVDIVDADALRKLTNEDT
jgi:CRP/FNR family transcriptional regulator